MLHKAQLIHDYLIKIRREIHQHPELGYQETNTAKLISKELDALGISYQTSVAKTGLIAEINNGNGPTILLRADLDALPIQEQTQLSFQSKTAGVMHACGHDTHTAMLLGAIKLLNSESFNGTLRFLFQPSEEGSYNDPDQFSGAQRVIAEGHLSDIDAAISLHQLPTLTTGQIAVTQGSVMAAADFFEIIIHGKSSHAGVSPEAGIDAIVIAAELIQSLQTIVSRKIGPQDTAVLSVCTIEGGNAPNIIADKVKMTGTIRAMNESTHQRMLAAIQSHCNALATMHNTKIELDYFYTVPVTSNDPTIQKIASNAAAKIVGANQVIQDLSIMGGEDFGYIAQLVPSCFALLGTKVTQGEVHPLHSPKMLVNEDALSIGSAYLAQTALDILCGISKP